MTSIEKINLLRDLLGTLQIDAYIILSSDEFQGEFTPECSQRLGWLTNFSGSNGLAIITENEYYFLTDSRYIIQAQQELPNDCQVFNIQDGSDIFDQIDSKLFIGYDPFICTKKFIKDFIKKFIKDNEYIKLLPLENNLIDQIWSRNKNFKTKSPLILNTKYTSETSGNKINNLINKLKTEYILITSPESICWLLNIRGNDLKYTPVIMAYCLIDNKGNIELFSNLRKINSTNIKIRIFHFRDIKNRIQELNQQNKSIQFDYSQTPSWFIDHFQKINTVIAKNPLDIAKAVKNNVELAGIKYAHIQDGIALVKLSVWLEKKIASNDEVTEIDVDQALYNFKKQNTLFRSKSFDTISSFGQNSAIIHYNPYNGNNAILTNNHIFLLDSGSQYECGTTDVTRTFFFGNPSDKQKLHYTLVLKGIINLSTLIFPRKTCGSQIDALARQFLWSYHLDYPHATGHGVGNYLSVHEGPNGINKFNNQELEPNMVVTIEPGYYIAQEYGIRIENIVVVKTVENNPNFLQLETMTLSPIAYNLIDKNLLTKREKKWLLHYHQKINDLLFPFLDDVEKKYLKKYVRFYTQLNYN